MKDELISFETAKLAKDRGFDLDVRHFYPEWDDVGEELYSCIGQGIGEFISDDESTTRGYGDVTRVSTQSLLQRWLRENHVFVISVEPCVFTDFHTYIFFVRHGEKLGRVISSKEMLEHNTYEEALEEALKESLLQLDSI